MSEVILTADRTLMSSYHDNEFLGFGTCAPPNFIPEWLYSYLFFPPLKTRSGSPVAAPYGLRKIEAQLLKEGFSVETVSPSHLGKYLKNAKILGIHAMDPFGMGPASTTLAALFKKEPYLAKHFQALLQSPAVRKAKANGLKIIVGGPGAWQFSYYEHASKNLGIDCVVEGEAENIIGKIFKAALEGQILQSHYEIGVCEAPSLEEIPEIVKPSINGLVEVGRGCCRGCQFCNVTQRPLRWYPLEKISREISVNINAGKTGACLHSEDMMLYGSKNTMPNEDKLVKLHEMVTKQCTEVGWSHCSLAAVASKPKLLSKISELILQNQKWWGAEVGIETGSSKIAKKIMPAKAHPFSAEKWHEVVVEGMGVMHDNLLVPACTLIVGLPEEQESDILETMDLIDDLKDVRCLIVPLFFVPLGKLKNKEWFNDTKLSELHKKLLIQCAKRDFRWVNDLIDMSFSDSWHHRLTKEFYKGFSAIARYRVNQIK